jgi:predicted DNA-binding transcriptional regulator AlpA
MTVKIEKEVINVIELSDYIRLSKSTIWKKTSNRTIPHFKVGKMLYFNIKEINSWLQSNRVETEEALKEEARKNIFKN